MNGTFSGAALVAQWRNGGDSPAGPLFAAGNFAEADIVNATGMFYTGYSSCSGSLTHECC
jgi:Family of unknown function (DUF6229)